MNFNKFKEKLYDILSFDTLVDRSRSKEEILQAQDNVLTTIRVSAIELLKLIDKNQNEKFKEIQVPEFLTVKEIVEVEIEKPVEIEKLIPCSLLDDLLEDELDLNDAIAKFRYLYVEASIKKFGNRTEASKILNVTANYLSTVKKNKGYSKNSKAFKKKYAKPKLKDQTEKENEVDKPKENTISSYRAINERPTQNESDSEPFNNPMADKLKDVDINVNLNLTETEGRR